jgi:glycosyltransferase involved in cell wall biosynthesis
MLKHTLPKVTILMCTFNGEKYIEDQLDSFQCQTYQNWRLIVSDDGSRDKTLRILKQYKKKWGVRKIQIIKGPQQGFSANFISLLKNKKNRGDYFFLSDQDDVWMPTKIDDYLTIFNIKKVSLIGGSSIYVTNKLFKIGHSLIHKHKPSFSNALVQSMFGGNTIAFNAKLKNQIESINSKDIPSYDWFLYILNTSVGNNTYYMQEPKIFYRQHEGSIVGSNVGFKNILKRFFLFYRGVMRSNISKNLCEIKDIKLITRTNRRLLNEFYFSRDRGLFYRLRIFSNGKFRRYGNFGSIVILLGSVFKKI